MRIPYVTKQVVLNAVAPAVSRMRGHHCSLGIDGDLRRVRAVLDWLREPLNSVGVNVSDKDILELGPGRTCELLLAFVLAGGRSGLGLDVSLAVPEDCLSVKRLGATADMLVVEGREFLTSVGSSPEIVRTKVRALAAMGDSIPISFP